MTSTKPIEMTQAFALTCVRCISHRFSGKTIVPVNDSSVQAVDKANAECHFEWGNPLETKDSFLTREVWNVTFDGWIPAVFIFFSHVPVVQVFSTKVFECTWSHLE